MKKIQDLYKKLWQSLIQPDRMSYTKEELRPQNHLAENGENFYRFDTKVDTPLGHKLAMSAYLPTNSNVYEEN